jgi:hypothetical protein
LHPSCARISVYEAVSQINAEHSQLAETNERPNAVDSLSRTALCLNRCTRLRAPTLLLLSALAIATMPSCAPDLEPIDWPDSGFIANAGARDGGTPINATTLSDRNVVPAASGERTDAGAVLPAALKGYELYAWSEGGHLYFTLIAGTNRQKTLEEVMRRGGGNTPGEASPIHGIGSSELSRVLMRVPQGTSVIVTGMPGLPPLGAEERATVERLVARGGTQSPSSLPTQRARARTP